MAEPGAPRDRTGLLRPEVGRWVLLATAALQIGSPVLVPFSGSDDGPPVVPAGYAFSIWSVIVLGCLAAAGYGLSPARARSAAYRAVHVRLSVVQVLFAAWLLAAVSPAVWLTVPIFLAMLVLLLAALREVLRAVRDDRSQRVTRVLLGGSLGLYAGWSTAAVWVNAATVLVDAGLPTTGTAGLLGQSAILLGAAGTAGWAARRVAVGSLPYLAAVAWALVAVIVAAATTAPWVAATAGAGLAGVLLAAATGRRGREPAPAM